MGKILIIKDADFSVNGMSLGEQTDIASTITLTRGYNVNGATTNQPNTRLGTANIVNLSSYISQGYTKLVAVLLTTGAHLHCLKLTNADESQQQRPSEGYVADNLSIDLTSSLPYLRYSTSKVEGTYGSATYTASALARILLIKY